MNFIDLGLDSGTKWLDCYNSSLIFSDDFGLFPIDKFKYCKEHIPTLEQFIELGKSCKIKKYNKGHFGFLLCTGPNGNKLRILESTWHHKGTGIRLLDYWINGEFFNTDNNTPNLHVFPENIGAYSIGNYINPQPYKKRCANLIFVDV